MVKRRTLGDGLTPEEDAFLNPAQAVPKSQPKQNSARKKDQPSVASLAPKQEPLPQATIQAAQSAFVPQIPMSGVMSLNTRISTEISTALLTASMQRKIQRQSPFTQQDIVAEALTDWLRKAGYLGQ